MDFPAGELLQLRRSPLQSIEVSQNDELRLLRTDRRAVQSALNPARPEQLVLPYMQAMMAGLLFQPPPQSVLLLGLGGGDLLRWLHHYLPQTHLKAVEIDTVMVEVCRDWFALPDSVTVVVDDAAHYIAADAGRYELLLIDIYSGDDIPGVLNERRFIQHCYERLADHGMLVANLLTNDAERFKSILWLLRRRFNCATLCLDVPGYANIIVFAFKQRPTRLTLPALTQQAGQLNKRFGMDFSDWAQQLFSTNPTAGGKLIF